MNQSDYCHVVLYQNSKDYDLLSKLFTQIQQYVYNRHVLYPLYYGLLLYINSIYVEHDKFINQFNIQINKYSYVFKYLTYYSLQNGVVC